MTIVITYKSAFLFKTCQEEVERGKRVDRQRKE
jgi:hypothetical protein